MCFDTVPTPHLQKLDFCCYQKLLALRNSAVAAQDISTESMLEVVLVDEAKLDEANLPYSPIRIWGKVG